MIEKIAILVLLFSFLGATLISLSFIRRDGPEESIPFLLGLVIFRFFLLMACSEWFVVMAAILGPILLLVGMGWFAYLILLAPPKFLYLGGGVVGQVSSFELWLAHRRSVNQEMREALSASRVRRR
ncbi:hypothetical protein M1413_00635 [Patescibacteria group bacterium]|nr:hypothetical protein [Patescibacteria group bacterium]